MPEFSSRLPGGCAARQDPCHALPMLGAWHGRLLYPYAGLVRTRALHASISPARKHAVVDKSVEGRKRKGRNESSVPSSTTVFALRQTTHPRMTALSRQRGKKMSGTGPPCVGFTAASNTTVYPWISEVDMANFQLVAERHSWHPSQHLCLHVGAQVAERSREVHSRHHVLLGTLAVF